MEERPENLCDYLLRKGYISKEQYDEARFTHLLEGGDLVSILRQMGVNLRDLYEAKSQCLPDDESLRLKELGLSPRDFYEAKAAYLKQPFVDLTVYRPNPTALNSVPETIVRRHNAIPILKDNNILYVAIEDTNNIAAGDDFRLASHCQIRLVLAVPEHIEEAIQRHYGAENNGMAEEPGD